MTSPPRQIDSLDARLVKVESELLEIQGQVQLIRNAMYEIVVTLDKDKETLVPPINLGRNA